MRISDSQIQLVNSRIDALIAADNFYGKKLKAAGITMGTLRFSIGLEEPEDIIAEFDEALNKL